MQTHPNIFTIWNSGWATTPSLREQIYLVCDLRPNMQFASHGHFKSVMAGRLTALSAFMANKKKDKLAYTLLTDKITSSVDTNGSDLIPILLNQLTEKYEDSGISFSEVIPHLGRHLKTGASLILFSDFYDIGEKELRHLGQLGQKNTITFIHIYDELERKLPAESLPYSDGKNTFIMDGKEVDKAFRKSWDEQTNTLRQAVQKYGLGYLALATDGPYLNLYSQFCWGDK